MLEITTPRHNPLVDPHLTVWSWEIPVYLFLGGLGLFAFIWSLRSGQYEDLDGAAFGLDEGPALGMERVKAQPLADRGRAHDLVAGAREVARARCLRRRSPASPVPPTCW